MINLDKLMLRREYFPIFVYDKRISFANIPVPHPLMMENGIDVDLAVSVLDTAVENIVADLESIKEAPYARRILEKLQRDSGGKIIIGNVEGGDWSGDWVGKHALIDPFPFLLFEKLFIWSKGISMNYAGGDPYIDLCRGRGHIYFPKDLELSTEIQEEYQLSKVGGESAKEYISPNTWYSHNFNPEDRIALKNLILAFNNATVRKKYLGEARK
jgi:hypothetical protein